MGRVRDALEAARDAVIERRRLERQAQFLHDAIGVRGRNYEALSGFGVFLDPSRHVDELLDWEAEQPSLRDLDATIEEGREIVRGISTMADPLTVRVLRERYILAKDWQTIAIAIGCSAPELAGMDADRLAAHLRRAIDRAIMGFEDVGLEGLKLHRRC